MPIFIKIPTKERKNLFLRLKNKLKLSFNKLPSKLGTSRTMFFNYYSGRHLIPVKLFEKIKEISGIKMIRTKRIKKPKYSYKSFIKPKLDIFLAEILGILNGDGHLSKMNNEVCVVLSYLERDYYNYVKKIFENTLGLRFTLQFQNTAVKIRCYSKELSTFLMVDYDVPRGSKLGNLEIPKTLFKSEKLLASYIRGLFDTDGSFFIRRKKDPVIQITSADPCFLKQVQQTLNLLKFNARISRTHIHIYNKEDIKRFFEIIKPVNSKHLKKYQNYLNLIVRG